MGLHPHLHAVWPSRPLFWLPGRLLKSTDPALEMVRLISSASLFTLHCLGLGQFI